MPSSSRSGSAALATVLILALLLVALVLWPDLFPKASTAFASAPPIASNPPDPSSAEIDVPVGVWSGAVTCFQAREDRVWTLSLTATVNAAGEVDCRFHQTSPTDDAALLPGRSISAMVAPNGSRTYTFDRTNGCVTVRVVVPDPYLLECSMVLVYDTNVTQPRWYVVGRAEWGTVLGGTLTRDVDAAVPVVQVDWGKDYGSVPPPGVYRMTSPGSLTPGESTSVFYPDGCRLLAAVRLTVGDGGVVTHSTLQTTDSAAVMPMTDAAPTFDPVRKVCQTHYQDPATQHLHTLQWVWVPSAQRIWPVYGQQTLGTGGLACLPAASAATTTDDTVADLSIPWPDGDWVSPQARVPMPDDLNSPWLWRFSVRHHVITQASITCDFNFLFRYEVDTQPPNWPILLPSVDTRGIVRIHFQFLGNEGDESAVVTWDGQHGGYLLASVSTNNGAVADSPAMWIANTQGPQAFSRTNSTVLTLLHT
jgi:hypothetical protein